MQNYHTTHCDHCNNILLCSNSECPIISCTLKCGFKLHECKLNEHLDYTCSLREINCINESNGCKIRLKKHDLTKHLEKCCANVIQCTSFRMRKIINKFEKYKKLKFPDPIESEKITNSEQKNPSLNDILLEQDYEYLRQFCLENPLKFQRMYGYLIGLKLNPNSSEFRLSFLNLLLKTVKSRIFKDIEAENCIVFNDDVGCIACQTRIKYLEIARFEKLKKDRYHFDFILRNIVTYEEFIEKNIYKDENFLKAYEEFYLKPSQDEVVKSNNFINETKEELDKKLEETNRNLLDSIELNPILKLNVAKELPCDAFQITYESYRINDSHFSVDCNSLLRRDEFSQHYDLYHNFIFNNSETIDHNCPFSEYGCSYYKTKYDFMFTNSFDCCHDLDNHPLNGTLNHDKLTNQINFKLKNLEDTTNNSGYNFLDLPFDVLYEIFNKLDSSSIYSLSLTSKGLRDLCEQFLSIRGIVYPKWVKKDESISDKNNNNVKQTNKWMVEKYVYTFSKHIELPKKIKLKNFADKTDNYNQHVQNCPYRICKQMNEPFKLFPPYTKKSDTM